MDEDIAFCEECGANHAREVAHAQAGQKSTLYGAAMLEVMAENHRLRGALEILLAQFGEYKDGDGAAKYHAINIAKAALGTSEADKQPKGAQ